MINLCFSGATNPMEVTRFLEKAGLSYEPMPVGTRKGDRFNTDFVTINPIAKVPAISHGDAIVFDTNAIRLYLPEKTDKFLPARRDANRGALPS